MKIKFEKYESGGNDFVLIDDRENVYDLTSDIIKKICNRNFGVGSDGLIILKKSSIADIKMFYYNSDGQPSTLCGNGTRCLFSFSLSLGINKKIAKIETIHSVERIRWRINITMEVQLKSEYLTFHSNSHLLFYCLPIY